MFVYCRYILSVDKLMFSRCMTLLIIIMIILLL